MKTKNTIGFAASSGELVSGQTTAYSVSTSLAWARKQGLNCELDIMSEQLRMQCRGLVQGWIVIAILLGILFFAGTAEAWSTQELGIRIVSIPPKELPTVRESLPTCAEYLEMDRELRRTGISAVLNQVLVAHGIEGEQMECMLDHVLRIDMTLQITCLADPGPWKDIFIRSVALYSPHCGLEVSP